MTAVVSGIAALAPLLVSMLKLLLDLFFPTTTETARAIHDP